MEHTCFDEQQVVCRLHRKNIKRKRLAGKILMNCLSFIKVYHQIFMLYGNNNVARNVATGGVNDKTNFIIHTEQMV